MPKKREEAQPETEQRPSEAAGREEQQSSKVGETTLHRSVASLKVGKTTYHVFNPPALLYGGFGSLNPHGGFGSLNLPARNVTPWVDDYIVVSDQEVHEGAILSLSAPTAEDIEAQAAFKTYLSEVSRLTTQIAAEQPHIDRSHEETRRGLAEIRTALQRLQAA